MERLPNELVFMIAENMTRCVLSRLSRASRTYWKLLEPLLYRQHGLQGKGRTGSAVSYVIESANPNNPETLEMSLIILDKVSRFCYLESAALDRCQPTSRPTAWVDSDRVCRLAFSWKIWTAIAYCYSLPPLHIAALKGLDDIAAWLLDQGASVDAPMPGTKITALVLAVLGNHASTALLLLDNHADPGPRLDGVDAWGRPSVLHMSCMLGLAEMVDQFLTRECFEADPSELLSVYQANCKSDVSRLAEVLVRHGAEVSPDSFGGFMREGKWKSARELLASPMLSDDLAAEEASCMLRDVVSLRCEELAKYPETVLCILRHLFERGADPDLGRLLWRGSSTVNYPALLKLLPPFLEAGMDVGPALNTRRCARSQAPVRCGVDDVLGHTSPYEKDQDEEDAAAQLSVIRLLLQYGAPVGGATRGDALDSYLGMPEEQLHGRARWSYKLRQVLLDHCRNMPEHERKEDVELFLDRFSEKRSMVRSTFLVDGL